MSLMNWLKLQMIFIWNKVTNIFLVYYIFKVDRVEIVLANMTKHVD